MNPYETLGKGLDRAAMQAAQETWDAVAKPLHGLGKLEDILVKIAGIQGTMDVMLAKRAVLVFCADNGVTAQGVTQTDSHVTAVVADNIADGKASVSRMCAKCGTDVFAVDIGIRDETHSERLLQRKIAKGTKDFSQEPAMDREEAARAVNTGIALVKEYREKGYTLFATGEMGIGNTTTSSAVTAALLGLSAEETVGRGAGLSNEGLRRKKEVVAGAIKRYGLYKKNALDVLACVGGFDIAGMAGVFIGGAMYGAPVVIDGMISAAAALAASRLCPQAVNCMIASHISREPSMKAVMDELGLSPVIDGSLALGEGTGAALLFPMLDMAESVYRSGETFSKIQIDSYQKYEE
ncbi:MAG: nicotinate-nucleotide--dimethylbenzimidazole phosphoribosyltransferase [Lachnospiraceae bacterium]|nr:nicotinate-nucleotide--dimethylbenzimidazole phosphoribosyltransferase [Lachnospiraceae bacterium]